MQARWSAKHSALDSESIDLKKNAGVMTPANNVFCHCLGASFVEAELTKTPCFCGFSAENAAIRKRAAIYFQSVALPAELSVLSPNSFDTNPKRYQHL
jgi:hypothetical protein